MTPKVPTMAVGTAASGMTADRQLCRKTSMTRATRNTASRRVTSTSWTDSSMKGVVS